MADNLLLDPYLNPVKFVEVGTQAYGSITIDSIGDTGDKIEVFAKYPIGTTVSLGSYIQQSTDTDTDTLAQSIEGILSGYDYSFTVTDSTINIKAPLSLGSLINGGSNLSVVITPYASVFDDSFDNTFN